MPNLQKIITSRAPLTLASVPAGFTPLLLADLTRAAKSSALFIATDDAAMRTVADTVPFFAPEIEILQFPSWDCLPYDRASPSLAITAQRIAALQAMQQPTKAKRLILTTIGAVIQRVLTPFRIRQTGERLAPGARSAATVWQKCSWRMAISGSIPWRKQASLPFAAALLT
jgi:transcription-repair coupling factor (superfamily II helicase)